MSHGVHNHGHHLHTHGAHGHHGAEGDQGAKAPTQAAQGTQPPSMDNAMAALDQAIQSLAANFHKDSFNGQQAPTGVESAPSTLTNSVGNRNSDLFLNNTPTAQAQAPVSAPTTTEAAPLLKAHTAGTTAPAADPLLDIKGGGGLSGGVIANKDFLNASGSGGLSGGVIANSR